MIAEHMMIQSDFQMQITQLGKTRFQENNMVAIHKLGHQNTHFPVPCFESAKSNLIFIDINTEEHCVKDIT